MLEALKQGLSSVGLVATGALHKVQSGPQVQNSLCCECSLGLNTVIVEKSSVCVAAREREKGETDHVVHEPHDERVPEQTRPLQQSAEIAAAQHEYAEAAQGEIQQQAQHVPKQHLPQMAAVVRKPLLFCCSGHEFVESGPEAKKET